MPEPGGLEYTEMDTEIAVEMRRCSGKKHHFYSVAKEFGSAKLLYN
ncbi:hypothetical protein [Candidatus Electronema sp. PJ]